MKLPYTYLVLCCCILQVMACTKKDNNSPGAKTLIAGIWQISGSDIIDYMGRDTTINQYSNWRPREQDDLLRFDENEIGSHDENANKCPEDNESDSFIWELKENDTKLSIVIGNRSLLYNVVELTDTQLRLKFTDTINSTPVNIIETYKNIR